MFSLELYFLVERLLGLLSYVCRYRIRQIAKLCNQNVMLNFNISVTIHSCLKDVARTN